MGPLYQGEAMISVTEFLSNFDAEIAQTEAIEQRIKADVSAEIRKWFKTLRPGAISHTELQILIRSINGV
jgi:hypothetical protein